MNYPKKKKKEPIVGLKEAVALQESMGFNCLFPSEKTNDNDNTKEKEPVEVVNRRIVELLKTEPFTVERTEEELQHTKAKTKEFNTLLKDGSEAYNDGQNNVATIKYKAALDMIADKTLKISDIEESVLRYMLYMTWLESGQLNDLMEAVQHLIALENSSSKTFPAVYYALSKAHYRLHRFALANETIEKGFACLDNEVKLMAYCMPGTHIILRESTTEGLLAALNAMKDDCASWHRPDAMCCKNDCLDNSQHYAPSQEIFFSDPAFNGMVIITCNNIRHPCVMKYHQNCWKLMKDELSIVQKMSDKDILGLNCFTPNCQNDEHVPSLIAKVEVIGEDAQIKAHIEAPTDPVVWTKRPAPPKAITPKLPTKPKRHVERIRKPAPTPTAVTTAQLPSNKEVIYDEEVEKEWRLAKLAELREINFGIAPDNDWRPDKKMYGNQQMIDVAQFLPDPEFTSESSEISNFKSFIFTYFYEYIKENGPVKIKEVEQKWEEEKYENNWSTLNLTDISELLLQSYKITAIGDYFCTPQVLPEVYSLVKDETTACLKFSLEYSLDPEEADIQDDEIFNQIRAGDYEGNEFRTSLFDDRNNEKEKILSTASDLIKWDILPATSTFETVSNDNAAYDHGKVQKVMTETEFENNFDSLEDDCKNNSHSQEPESDVDVLDEHFRIDTHFQTPEIPTTEQKLGFNIISQSDEPQYYTNLSTMKPEHNDNYHSDEQKSNNEPYEDDPNYKNGCNSQHTEIYRESYTQDAEISNVQVLGIESHSREVDIRNDCDSRDAKINCPNPSEDNIKKQKHADEDVSSNNSLSDESDFENMSHSPNVNIDEGFPHQELNLDHAHHSEQLELSNDPHSQELPDMSLQVPQLINEALPVQSNFDGGYYSNAVISDDTLQDVILNDDAYSQKLEETGFDFQKTNFDIDVNLQEPEVNPTKGAMVDPSYWFGSYSQELEQSFNTSSAKPTSSYSLEQELNQTSHFQDSNTRAEKHSLNPFLSPRKDTNVYSIPEEKSFTIKNETSASDCCSGPVHQSKIAIQKQTDVDVPLCDKETKSSAINEVPHGQWNPFKPSMKPVAQQVDKIEKINKKLLRVQENSVSQEEGAFVPAETLIKLQMALEHDRLKSQKVADSLQNKVKLLEKNYKEQVSTLKNDFSKLQESNLQLMSEKTNIEQSYEIIVCEFKKLTDENSRLKLETAEAERNLGILCTEKNVMEAIFEKEKDKLDKKMQKCHSRLKDKATEIEALQSKLIEMENSAQTLNKSYNRNSRKECLHFEFVANETVLNAAIQKCHKSINILNDISRIVSTTSGISFHVGTAQTPWQQTLTHLHKISSEHKVQYARLSSLLEKDEESENMEDIRLPLPEIPSPPQSNISEVLQSAFVHMHQSFRMQFHKSTPMQHRFPQAIMGQYHPSMRNVGYYPNFRQPYPNQQAGFYNMQNTKFQSGFGNNQSNPHQTMQQPPYSNFNKNNSQELPLQNNNINQLSPNAHPPSISYDRNETLQSNQTNGNSTSDLQQTHTFTQNKNADNKAEAGRGVTENTQEAVMKLEEMRDKNQQNENQPVTIVQTNNNNQTQQSTTHVDINNMNVIHTETPTGGQKKPVQRIKNIDGVMQQLRKKFVGVLESDLLDSLNDVRRMNNNSLSGMRVADIISQAEAYIIKRQEKQLYHYSKPMEMPAPERPFGQTIKYNLLQTTSSSTHLEQSKPPKNENQVSQNQGKMGNHTFEMLRSPTPKKAAWGAVKSGLPDWKKEREDPECSICWEPMEIGGALSMYTLKCQHSFHTECIKKWLDTNRACPKCRVHCTMDNDYPPLPS